MPDIIYQDRTIRIDSCFLHLLDEYSWYFQCDGYLYTRYNGKSTGMHRMIMELSGVDISGYVVDHINGNILDNRLTNLRCCSISQNLRNRGKNRNNTTGYKGVVKVVRRGLEGYRAEIRHNYRKRYSGTFPTAVEAAMEYNRMALELHGEFARLNVIPTTG